MARTPVILVAGQGDTDDVTGRLLRRPGTLVIEHRFDGHVVRRTTITAQQGMLVTAETALELAHGCISCTVRNDLLVLLRKLHRREDVDRIVVHLAPWLEPEPICWAINHVQVEMGPGHLDGPAAADVEIAAVMTCVDTGNWLARALGDEELGDGRTVAQVVVGQAEFADVLVLTEPDAAILAVLKRLAPSSRITVGSDHVEMALAHLEPDARRGRSDTPDDPLLAGQPPLHIENGTGIIEFGSRRPFHPQRLHDAVDLLLDGVIRTRGRIWLASQWQRAMWIESAGGGMRTDSAGKWLAAMSPSEAAYVDSDRRAMADLIWQDDIGDRHTSLTVLVCGADRDQILGALHGALLTDDEMAAPHAWADYPDPFGDWHHDPCDEVSDLTPEAPSPRGLGGEH